MLSKQFWWSAGAFCVLGTGYLMSHVSGQQAPLLPLDPPPSQVMDLPRIIEESSPPVTPTSPSKALPRIAPPTLLPALGAPTSAAEPKVPTELPPVLPPARNGQAVPGAAPMPPSGFLFQENPPPTVGTPPATPLKTPPSLPPFATAPEPILPPVPTPATPPAPNLDLAPKPETTQNFVPEVKPGVPLAVDPGLSDEALPTGDIKLGKQEPTVSIEWVTKETGRLNQPLPCQIMVKNNGAVSVHNVVVRHNLLPGVTLHASEPAAKQDRQLLAWDLGVIPAGSARSIDLKIVSSLRGNLTFPTTVSFAATTAKQVQFREPLLQIQARAQEKSLQGEPVVFAFAVSNPGDGGIDSVKVRALLPEGLDHPRGHSVELVVGALAPKESKTLQIQCIARSAGVQQITFVAQAEGDLTAQAKAQTEVVLPRLDVAIAGPKLRYVERPAQYVAKVANPGTAPATGVVVTQVVPAGFKFHSATAGGRFDEAARQVVWSVGELLPGQSREVSVDLIPTTAGDFKLPVHAVSASGVRNESDIRTRVEGLSSIVMEVADTDDPVEVNGETAYEIRVLNAGTKIETNLELVCTLPDQAELKEARCIAGLKHRVEGRTVVFEPATRLAPRADLIYRIVVRGKLPGDGRFRAQVRAEGMTDAVTRDETTRFYRDDK